MTKMYALVSEIDSLDDVKVAVYYDFNYHTWRTHPTIVSDIKYVEKIKKAEGKGEILSIECNIQK